MITLIANSALDRVQIPEVLILGFAPFGTAKPPFIADAKSLLKDVEGLGYCALVLELLSR